MNDGSLTNDTLLRDGVCSASEISASQPALKGLLAYSGCTSTRPSAVTCSCQMKGWTEGGDRDLNQVSQVSEKRKEVWRAC